jgi:hypothetical protein
MEQNKIFAKSHVRGIIDLELAEHHDARKRQHRQGAE